MAKSAAARRTQAAIDKKEVRKVNFQTPRVYLPLLQRSRYKGLFGGRGSGKSHILGELLIDRHIQAAVRSLCVREIQKSLKTSVKALLDDKIKKFDIGDLFRSTNTYIETPFDGVIEFTGMQNHTADSVKSYEGIDIAWVEEAQSLSQRSLDLLVPTIRKEQSELWFSWNPRFKTDPVDVLLRGPHPPLDAIVVESSFRDNPWFPSVLRPEVRWMKAHDADKYEHIWLGGYEESSESRIFKNFRVEEFETPADAVFYLGGDWGFSIDPAVLVRLFFEQPRTIKIDWEVYRVGVEVDHLPAFFDLLGTDMMDVSKTWPENQKPGMARNWEITADSQQPQTISYLQRHGYPKLKPAIKGPNSVEEGVKFLQGYEIIIHPRCVHTADEFSSYRWKVDKITQQILPILPDKKNHVIDGVRYAVEDIRKATSQTWLTF